MRYRSTFLDRLARQARGLPPADDVDAEGRLILVGYEAIRDWLGQFSSV